MKGRIKLYLQRIGQYFNLLNDKEDEREVVEQVSSGVVFRGTNLWILMFAILIASLGLNVNSTAVIIGAMLISPLMGPIIGMGLSVGIGDYDLLRRALKNYGVATLISIATATLYFLISPLNDARSELLARTSPSLYDVLIAFCGGAAGVLALTTKSKGQVIPGVAIATALMPPLCTAGYGLATWQLNYFLGAFYLFFINTVFIAVATFLGVKLMRFHSNPSVSPEVARRGRKLVTWVVVITMIPAAIMTVNIVRDNVFERNVHSFVDKELSQNGTRILTQNVEGDTLHVVAVGRTISEAEVADARSRMGYYGLKGYALDVIQGTDSEGLETLASRLNSMVVASDASNQVLQQQLSDLEERLAGYTVYDELTAKVSAEAAALFPQVAGVDVGKLGGGVVAIVRLGEGGRLSKDDEERIAQWLRARVMGNDIEIIVR